MQKTNSNPYYYTLNDYLKRTIGEKCYKIAIDAGLTCPNRDGKVGNFGCTFCSSGGSGDFAVSGEIGSIQAQIDAGLLLFQKKQIGHRYIAYYQAYTNTYGEVSYLERIYREALEHPDIAGISIATRPDCLPGDILDLLHKLTLEYAPKFIWIELGLQTCHDETARLFGRGYPVSVFETAMKSLSALSIPVIVHMILGLPGETPEEMYETIHYINRFRPFGIKLQLLHLLKGTRMAASYGIDSPVETCGDFLPLNKRISLRYSPKDSLRNSLLHIFSMEEYLDTLIHCLEILSPEIVVHRVTGDGPKDLLLAPLWSQNKKRVLNSLHRTMKVRSTYQGRLFHDSGFTHHI